MKKPFVSAKNESVRMFSNPVLDKISRVHYTTPLILFVPFILFLLYQTFFNYGTPALKMLLLYGGGLAFWSLAEYVLHRFLFHLELPGELGKRIHFISHGVHHDYPNDAKRLVMPPALSIPLAAAFYGLFLLVFGGDKGLMFPFFAGFLNGYLVYDMLHYAIHHATFTNPIFQTIKRHHMVHHFHEPDRGFGVSSKLWDEIFRSTFRIDKKDVPPPTEVNSKTMAEADAPHV